MTKKQLDLSAFKVKDKGLLVKTEKNISVERKVDSIIERIDKPNKSHQVGRPRKALEEKESKPITLKFTESQYQKIVNDAGDIPLATFLKRQLLNTGLI